MSEGLCKRLAVHDVIVIMLIVKTRMIRSVSTLLSPMVLVPPLGTQVT